MTQHCHCSVFLTCEWFGQSSALSVPWKVVYIYAYYCDDTWVHLGVSSISNSTVCSTNCLIWQHRENQSSTFLVLCDGNSPVTDGLSTQMTTCMESVVMPKRHHIPLKRPACIHSVLESNTYMSRVYNDNHTLTVANPSLGTNRSKCKLVWIHFLIVENMPSILIAAV